MTSNEALLGEELLQRHGLEREPFADEVFFVTDDLERALGLAGELLVAGGLLIIGGAAGVGRTAFLEELTERHADRSPALISGHAGLTLTTLLEALALPASSDAAAIAEALRERRQSSALLLDDADEMAQPELKRLLELRAALLREGIQWPLMLVSQKSNTDALRAWAHYAGHGKEQIQRIKLPPFGPQQSRQYLQWRLQRAGASSTNPIMDATALERIHQRAGGTPAELHRETADMLAEPAHRRALRAASGHPWQSVALAAASLLVAGVLISWLIRGPAERKLDEQQDTVAQLDISDDRSASGAGSGMAEIDAGALVAATEEGPPATANAGATSRGARVAAGEETPSPETAGSGATAPAEGNSANAGPSNPSPVAEPAGEADPGANTGNTAGSPASAGESAPSPPQEANAAESPTSQSTTTAQWLAERAQDHYTIQVLSARERATAERFLGAANGGSRLHIVETKLDGEPWLAVVTGDYPDAERARNAIKRLPEPWRRFGPFARPFSSLGR